MKVCEVLQIVSFPPPPPRICLVADVKVSLFVPLHQSGFHDLFVATSKLPFITEVSFVFLSPKKSQPFSLLTAFIFLKPIFETW